LDGTESADLEDRETSIADRMEKCSKYIEANPGCTKGTIETKIGGNNRYVREALEELKKGGWIKVEKGNAYRHTSERPFRHRSKVAKTFTESINGRGVLGPSSVLAR
jgi:predicted HTH transcriptional regulator